MARRQDPYRILRVTPDAAAAEIRRSYQRLARRYHPDLRPADRRAERRFQEIARAWEILSDPELRRRYDRGDLDPREGEAEFRAGRLGVIGGFSVSARIEELIGVTIEDDVGPEAAEETDLEVRLTLDFAEAIRGATTSLSVQRDEVCGRCGGSGAMRCGTCSGRGRVVRLERLRVRVPPGVSSGGRLRLPGRGLVGEDGRKGDLFVAIRVLAHPYFERRGADIHASLPVTYAEAALGGNVEVPTIDGPVTVKLPAGVPSGQRFRLVDRGVALPDGLRGDHYYRVEIVPPVELEDSARALLAQLRQPDPRADLPDEPL